MTDTGSLLIDASALRYTAEQAVSEPATPRLLLPRREAAEALGMSLSHFQRHVQPHIRCVYSGQLRLYALRDLERWAEDNACREGNAAGRCNHAW